MKRAIHAVQRVSGPTFPALFKLCQHLHSGLVITPIIGVPAGVHSRGQLRKELASQGGIQVLPFEFDVRAGGIICFS